MSWYVRILQEVKSAQSCVFVTLTYDDDHLPVDDDGVPYVSKRDLQLFFKRLRKREPDFRLRYFACSEYGPTTFRPHYHMILLNLDSCDDVSLCWQNGFVSFGEVNEDRIKYCAKYMVTKSVLPPDLVKPFSLVSKGMGVSYVEQMKDWHLSNPLEKFYVPYFDRKLPLPRYYKEKIFSSEIKLEFSNLCFERAQEKYNDLYEDLGSDQAVSDYRSAFVRDFRNRLRRKLVKNAKL